MTELNRVKQSAGCILSKLKACTYSALLTPLVLSPAFAGPTGGNIVGGAGNINQSNLTTTINQNTQRLAIDWQTFDVNRDETVNFNQPNQSSIALNRITDANPSQIQGTINANGQIIIANPNGVFFGKNSTVNASALFASALDIDPQDFMQGNLDFKALEGTSGLIVNDGTLQVIDGGTLALLGQKIKNEGLLIAQFGTVTLAAGSDIKVSFDEYGYLSVGVSQGRLASILELDDAQILNTGIIQAHGGRVVLTAKQAEDIKNSIKHIDESDRFSKVVVKDGVVYFTGADGDISDLGDIDVSNDNGDAGTVVYDANNVHLSGTINADSQNGNGGNVFINAADLALHTAKSKISAQSKQNGTGGKVHVQAKNVGLTDTASINASGANGGGEVLIGGDYQGKNPDIKNADAVYLGEDTQVSANATDEGNGGKVIVWSEKTTRAYGGLSATGGKQSGDGGFIETSSRDYVDLRPDVDLHAENGLHGEWLIDPSFLSISSDLDSGISGGSTGPTFTSNNSVSNLDMATLKLALESGANVTVQTTVNMVTVPFPIGCTTTCTGTTQVDQAPESTTINAFGKTYHYGDIALVTDLDYDNIGASNRDTENASSLTLRAHRDIHIDAAILDSDSDNGTGRNFVPDGDILNLSLVADWQGSGGADQVGTAGLGDVFINANVNLQGGNFSASGVNFVQNGIINTQIPAETSSTGFDPVAVFGGAGITPDGSVTINVQNDATLGRIITRDTTGSLNVTAANGSISGTPALTISGTSTFNTAGNITLENTANDFIGTIDINNGLNISLTDINDISVNLTSNNVTGIATNTGGTSTIVDSNLNGTVLNAMTVGGGLNVTATGNITDAGVLTVSGPSTFKVSNGRNIILNNVGNTFNNTVQFLVNGVPGVDKINNLTFRNDVASDFNLQSGLDINGSLNLRAQSLTLNDFTLGNNGTLALTAVNGGIVQTSAINHSGRSVLSATGDIFDPVVTNNPENNLADVQINSARNVSINNGSNAIVLRDVSVTNNLSVIATGGISSTDVIDVANLTTFDAGTNAISLDFSAHNFNQLQIDSAGSVTVVDNDDLMIAGSMNRLFVLTGFNSASSTLSNIRDSVLKVTEDTRIILQRGGDINLANFSTPVQRNNLQGSISLEPRNGRLDDFSLRNTANIDLAALDINNNLNLNSLGTISQTGPFKVNGTTTLQGNSINLLQQANEFRGDVTINDSGVVAINNTANGTNVIVNNTDMSNTVDLKLITNGQVDIQGELLNMDITVFNDNIRSSGALRVENNTTVNAGLIGLIDFQSNPVDLENLNIIEANSANITDMDNLTLTNASVNNLLDITATGAVKLAGDIGELQVATTTGGIENSASSLHVARTTLLDAASSDIMLNNSANDFNTLDILSAQDVTIEDASSILLQTINARDFSLTTRGNIQQTTGTLITSTRDAILNAGSGNITLGENNRLTNLSVNANQASIVNDQALLVNDSKLSDSLNLTTNNGNLSINRLQATNTINLNAADQLVDTNAEGVNIIANKAILRAVNGIGAGSDINTQISHLEAYNTTRSNISIDNVSNRITLDNIVNTADDSGAPDENGNFTLETNNDVLIDRISLRQDLNEDFFPAGTGTVFMHTVEGDFLGVGPENRFAPDISATNLRLVAFKGTIGDFQRSLVLDITGKVEINAFANLNPIYAPNVPAPEDIKVKSILDFVPSDTLAAVNGIQIADVETLLDISPAIFTDLRHFAVNADPVMMPRDQLFDNGYTIEDDDEYFSRIEDAGKAVQ